MARLEAAARPIRSGGTGAAAAKVGLGTICNRRFAAGILLWQQQSSQEGRRTSRDGLRGQAVRRGGRWKEAGFSVPRGAVGGGRQCSVPTPLNPVSRSDVITWCWVLLSCAWDTAGASSMRSSTAAAHCWAAHAIGRGGGGDCGQGASKSNCDKVRKIAGKLRCRNQTSRSLKGQHLCTGDTQGTHTHASQAKSNCGKMGKIVGKLRKMPDLNPPPPLHWADS